MLQEGQEVNAQSRGGRIWRGNESRGWKVPQGVSVIWAGQGWGDTRAPPQGPAALGVAQEGDG